LENVESPELFFDNDELKIYRGKDYVVSKHIIIHQPTLDEICEYGENDYWSLVRNFTATPQSMKVQLWDIGKDYTEITPYELFTQLLYKIFPQEKTSIIFGDLDFNKFELAIKDDSNELFLAQYIDNDLVAIDEYTYSVIVDYLSKSHYIERDLRIPANNTTKMILIEDARDEILKNKNKPQHSQLKNLISTMVNSEGFKYNHTQVWEMKINAFMDSVKRIGKIKNANLLLQSGYSGFGVNLKQIDDKLLDWLGELE
jgi:hypothetical protein